jgi:hypothetical protein
MPSAAIKKQETESVDLKRRILDRLGNIDDYNLAPGEVLLAIYVRPDMSPGGIALVAQTLKEDLYQGKAHLVLKIGPGCDFYGLDVKLHDWVVVRPSDGWALDLNSRPDVLDRKDYVPCRHILSKAIKAIIPHPGFVW